MKYINTSEKWGERTAATVADYKKQSAIFGERHDWTKDEEGIYCDGEQVAEAVKSVTYTARNVYGIAGESNHRTPEAAIKAAARREGEGWIVEDQDGNRWWWNGDRSKAVIVAHADASMLPLTQEEFVNACCELAGTRNVANESDDWYVEFGRQMDGETLLDCRMRQDAQIDKYDPGAE